MFKFFKKKKEPENFQELLNEFKENKKKLHEMSKKLNDLRERHECSVQKVGMVRFNPFKETGGDQSFSVAFLDENDNGVVITSLYGREGNRIFAKPLKRGLSKYSLSEEEKKAINKAKQKKQLKNEK